MLGSRYLFSPALGSGSLKNMPGFRLLSPQLLVAVFGLLPALAPNIFLSALAATKKGRLSGFGSLTRTTIFVSTSVTISNPLNLFSFHSLPLFQTLCSCLSPTKMPIYLFLSFSLFKSLFFLNTGLYLCLYYFSVYLFNFIFLSLCLYLSFFQYTFLFPY